MVYLSIGNLGWNGQGVAVYKMVLKLSLTKKCLQLIGKTKANMQTILLKLNCLESHKKKIIS